MRRNYRSLWRLEAALGRRRFPGTLDLFARHTWQAGEPVSAARLCRAGAVRSGGESGRAASASIRIAVSRP